MKTNLKQQTIQKIMHNAGEEIAAVERHTGLIAEAEALADRLNDAAPGMFTPVVCTCGNHIKVWLQIDHKPRRAVYAAIEGAGVVLAGESLSPDNYIQVHLEGFDVPVFMGHSQSALATLSPLAEAA